MFVDSVLNSIINEMQLARVTMTELSTVRICFVRPCGFCTCMVARILFVLATFFGLNRTFAISFLLYRLQDITLRQYPV